QACLLALADQEAGAKKMYRFEGQRADRFLQLGLDAQIEIAGLWSGAHRGDQQELFRAGRRAALGDVSAVLEIHLEIGVLRTSAADGGSQSAKDVGGWERIDLFQLVEIDGDGDQARMLKGQGAAGERDDTLVIFRLEKRFQTMSADQSGGSHDQCRIL